jgi:hemolysin activation/secretion protein
VIPFISGAYSRDDGVFLGVSLKIIRHGFRKDPYKNMHEFAVNQAFSTKAWNFRYYSEFIGTFGRKSDLLFDADIKAPNNTTNFFGYGINSDYDKTSPGQFRYYRARSELGDISLLLRKRFSEKVIMTLGPTFQFFTLDQNDKFNMVRFITDIGNNGLDPNTLYNKQSYFGGKFSFIADTRDNKVLTRRGIMWMTTLRHLAGQNNASYDVTQLNSEFSFYLPLSKGIVLAERFGGGKNFGDFEFYQAQYLGSEDNLRGYRKYRFAGYSKFFNNIELRMKIANFNTYLFPGSLGFLFFFDTGKVWADVNNSDKWVSGYGAGFWFSPLSRILISVSYAASKEDKLALIGLVWNF